MAQIDSQAGGGRLKDLRNAWWSESGKKLADLDILSNFKELFVIVEKGKLKQMYKSLCMNFVTGWLVQDLVW